MYVLTNPRCGVTYDTFPFISISSVLDKVLRIVDASYGSYVKEFGKVIVEKDWSSTRPDAVMIRFVEGKFGK